MAVLQVFQKTSTHACATADIRMKTAAIKPISTFPTERMPGTSCWKVGLLGSSSKVRKLVVSSLLKLLMLVTAWLATSRRVPWTPCKIRPAS